MKGIISNSVLFVILAIVFSSLTGCGGGDDTAVQQQDSNAQPEVRKEKPPAPNARPLSAEVTGSELKLIEGGSFKLSDKKGKVVLLNLWATWCGPCRAEMPTLVKLQDEFRDQGFEVIGLNTDDESPEKINPFAEEMKLNYTLVWSDGSFQNELLKISRFPGIPQSFLIDRDGHLRAVFTGGSPETVRKLDENVKKLINEEA